MVLSKHALRRGSRQKETPTPPHTPLTAAGAAMLGSAQPTEQPRPCAVASSLPPPLQHPAQRSDALSPSASRAPRGCPDRTGGRDNWHISTIREYCQSKTVHELRNCKNEPKSLRRSERTHRDQQLPGVRGYMYDGTS